MKKITLIASSMLFISGLTFPVYADDHGVKSEKQAETIVHFRQSLLQLIRSNMGPLGAMAKGKIPYDAEQMEKHALRMEQLALMMEDYFKPDTSKFDVATDAKDEIWQNKDDFLEKARDLVKAASALKKVAASENENQYRKAIGAVGGSCKACHDEYKKD